MENAGYLSRLVSSRSLGLHLLVTQEALYIERRILGIGHNQVSWFAPMLVVCVRSFDIHVMVLSSLDDSSVTLLVLGDAEAIANVIYEALSGLHPSAVELDFGL